MRPVILDACIVLLAACSPRPEAEPSHSAEKSTESTSAVVEQADSSTWRIAPRGSGALNTESSEADLRRRFGSSSVDSTRIQIGEGETAPGTVLYPGDSARRVEIIWRDSLRRERPARIILRGTGSQWQVGGGVSLGKSLQELEQVNGRSFTLAGFGWDYGGVVTDWKGGALDTALAGVKVYLDPGLAAYRSPAYNEVLGDRDYSSAVRPMQQLNPRVAQIFVDFEAP